MVGFRGSYEKATLIVGAVVGCRCLGSGSGVADGKRTVKIECKQSYGVGPWTMKLDHVDTTLMLDKGGKIEKHTDEWRGWWGQFGIGKRIFGSSSSILLRLLRV